jgi:ABC-type microcin C transport system permease subunit YejE
MIGRDALSRSKSHLHFVLITTDIIANHREEVLKNFMHYPVVQHYTAADFERMFKMKGAKAVGFAKSSLAKNIYAALKKHRINEPLHPSKKTDAPPAPPAATAA